MLAYVQPLSITQRMDAFRAIDFYRGYGPRMLTTSAMVSGRVLNNPAPGVEPHIEFMEQAADKVKTVKEDPAKKEEEDFMLSCMRLFVLGQPNTKGEATPGPEKVKTK